MGEEEIKGLDEEIAEELNSIIRGVEFIERNNEQLERLRKLDHPMNEKLSFVVSGASAKIEREMNLSDEERDKIVEIYVDEIVEIFGSSDSEDSDPYKWLGKRSYQEVKDDVSDVDSTEFLEELYDEAETRPRAEAIHEELMRRL